MKLSESKSSSCIHARRPSMAEPVGPSGPGQETGTLLLRAWWPKVRSSTGNGWECSSSRSKDPIRQRTTTFGHVLKRILGSISSTMQINFVLHSWFYKVYLKARSLSKVALRWRPWTIFSIIEPKIGQQKTFSLTTKQWSISAQPSFPQFMECLPSIVIKMKRISISVRKLDVSFTIYHALEYSINHEKIA